MTTNISAADEQPTDLLTTDIDAEHGGSELESAMGTPGMAADAVTGSAGVMTPQVQALVDAAQPLFARAGELAPGFQTAQPWAHAVLTDLVPEQIRTECFEQERARIDQLQGHVSHRQMKAETNQGFGPAATAILDFLDSGPVVDFLRELTGISDLVSDPTHFWAGLHVNGPGAFHSLHQDFPRHPINGMWHRVNVLMYLNPTWPSEWGGALELWKKGGRIPAKVVAPHAPNTVVFETDARSIHGLPDPITCPEGHYRLSLNSFYYSHQAPTGDGRLPLIRRPRRPQDPWRTGFATRAELISGLQERTPERVKELRRTVLSTAKSTVADTRDSLKGRLGR